MTTIAKLLIEIGANGSSASRTFDEVTNKAQQTESNVAKVGKAIAGGAFAGAVTSAIRSATSSITTLNAEMANVASLGIATDRVNELKTGVQDLSVTVGKGTSDLTDGLYQVISAFGDSADSIDKLEINAKAATAGLATTTDAINLTSAVTKAYGDTSAEAVQHAADLAFTAVRLGQTTFPELASAVGKVTPLMASLGATQEELFAILATGTGVTGTASEVVTQLRGVLQSAMAPTADMAGLIEEMGFSSGAAAVQGLGVVGFMQEVVKAADQAGVPLQKYISSIEGQTLALALAGELAGDYASKSEEVLKATGALDAAFDAQTKGINEAGFTYQQLTQRVEVLKQRLGEALLPVLGSLLRIADPIVGAIERMATTFTQLPQPIQNVIVIAGLLITTIGPLLPMLALIGSVAGPALAGIGAVFAAMVSPIGLVVAGVVALGAALMALSGIDIGATISAAMPSFSFDAESQVGTLDWGNFIGSVDLKEKVANVEWGNFIGSVNWENKIANFSWGNWVTFLDWGEKIGYLNWGDFVFRVNWDQYIGDFKIGDLYGSFNLQEKVADLRWGDFIGTLDWGAQVGQLYWGDFIGILDWGSKLATFVWGDYVGFLDWGERVAQLTWGDYVAQLTWGENIVGTVDWGSLIGTFNWNDKIAQIEWGNFIYSLDWQSHISYLSWGEFVYRHDWANYVTQIGWGDYVVTLDWMSYIQTLSDWGSYITSFSWSEFIESLTWENIITKLASWTGFIAALIWNAFVVGIDLTTFVVALVWTNFLQPLTWENIVTKLSDWSTYIATLDWSTKVEALTWENVVARFDSWTLFIARLSDWSAYVAAVAWNSFISNINWPAFITMVNWSQFVPNISWSGFVSRLNWKTYVPTLSWNSWLEKIDWAGIIPDFSWSTFIPKVNWSIPSFPGWGALVGGNQIGTPSFSGGLTWVGEQGPELVALPPGSRIWSNDISENMARGMGGKTEINVTANQVSSEIDIISFAQRIADILEWRQQGR